MHQLPFGAKMTDKLFGLVKEQHLGLGDDTDYAWSFVYGERSLRDRGKYQWGLKTVPRKNVEPERLFIVAGIAFYIGGGLNVRL
jgi:hypothetical protein